MKKRSQYSYVNQGIESQPISHVVWVNRDDLFANNYNPNKVAKPEFELLRESIRQDGWSIPLIVRKTGEIVDGFHRWTISGEPEFREMTDGLVPVVYLPEVDLSHQIESTIRYNRARGKHGVVPMADIVNKLIKHGVPRKKISQMLGMDDEEITRLYNYGNMPTNAGKASFGKGWKPDGSKKNQ